MFGIFRASFDGSLRRREWTTARVSAALVTVTILASASAGAVALLHVSSDKLNELANAREARELRALDAKATADKPCKEQSWPFIDRRCLWSAKGDPDAAKAVPAPSKVASGKPVPGKTAVATTGSPSPAAAASSGEEKAAKPNQTNATPAPAPVAAIKTNDAAAPANPPQHPGAQPGAHKNANRDVHHNANAQAREVKPKQRVARRIKRDEERAILSLPEYRPEMQLTPFGTVRRVYVIGRGSMNNPYYGTMR